MPRRFSVSVDERAVREFVNEPDGPVVQDLIRRTQTVTRSAIRRAPSSKHGSHGRGRGYLRSQIRWVVGKDAKGPYIDVVSPALNPRDGKPYGLFQEHRHPYLRPALGSLPRR
jgi:hypothetical protein